MQGEKLGKKTSTCLCPRKDYEYSSCFLIIPHLITPRQTFVDMPRADSGPVLCNRCTDSGCIATTFILLTTGIKRDWRIRRVRVNGRKLGNLASVRA